MNNMTDAIRRIGIEAVLPMRRAVCRISGGKLQKSMFSEGSNKSFIGTDVRIVQERDDAVFLAKFDADGKFSNRDFVILSTTDLHLGDGSAEDDLKSIDRLSRQIADVKPDLVIFTGDIVQTDHQHIDAVQFADMMEQFGIYWLYAFGNHESREPKGNFKHFLYECLQSRPHCLCRFGYDGLFGYGNFALHIMNSLTSLSQSLYIFDSGRDIDDISRSRNRLPAELNGYDFLKPCQINWYKNHVKEIEKQYGATKSMQYYHIPLPEFAEVFDKTGDNEFTPSGKAEILYGEQHEGIGCSPYNSGMFAAIKELGSTQAIFCGHDHANDFCAKYDGVYLVYNQPGGYGTYSLDGYQGIVTREEKDRPYAVTLTTVHSDGNIEITQRRNAIYL